MYGDVEPTDVFFKGDDGTYIKGEFPATGNVTIRNVQKQISYKISEGDLSSTLQDFVDSVNNSFNAQGFNNITFAVMDGGLQIENNSGEALSIADNQTTDFLTQVGFDDALDSAKAGQTLFYSNTMNKYATISTGNNTADAIKRSDWYVSEGGIVTAKYNDGSSLTVSFNDNGRALWQYTTSDNVVITSSGAEGTDLDMSSTGMEPAIMVIEMGSVINDAGLISQTDNLWSLGPNAGEFAYGMANTNGFGSLKSGGLEGSNVDMATELSNMIMAQRAIQANSRVFSTASSVLETITYLGQ